MVKFTMEVLRHIMDLKHNIRSMSVIVHVDHGKSTLTDSLVVSAGIITQETTGDARMTDTHADEAECGITIKFIGTSLYYEMSDQSLKTYKVNELVMSTSSTLLIHLDDQYINAIINCDSEGLLMFYVSKMIPASDKGRLFACGRVFVGKVVTGAKAKIMGPNYISGGKKDL